MHSGTGGDKLPSVDVGANRSMSDESDGSVDWSAIQSPLLDSLEAQGDTSNPRRDLDSPLISAHSPPTHTQRFGARRQDRSSSVGNRTEPGEHTRKMGSMMFDDSESDSDSDSEEPCPDLDDDNVAMQQSTINIYDGDDQAFGTPKPEPISRTDSAVGKIATEALSTPEQLLAACVEAEQVQARVCSQRAGPGRGHSGRGACPGRPAGRKTSLGT